MIASCAGGNDLTNRHQCRRARSIWRTSFSQNVADVMLHCVDADEKFFTDFLVSHTLGYKGQDVHLTAGESESDQISMVVSSVTLMRKKDV